MTRPRTLEDYRQAILRGLAPLTNEDLGLLLACHFIKISHVQDTTKNKTNILLAPMLVIDIWTRVSEFLATHGLPPLEGEQPPTDLANWSTRTQLAEPPSNPPASSVSGAWSSTEITLPSHPPQLATVGASSVITAEMAAIESVDPVVRKHSLRRRLLRRAIGGLATILVLIAIHLPPSVKQAFLSTKRDPLPRPDPQQVRAPATPQVACIQAAEASPVLPNESAPLPHTGDMVAQVADPRHRSRSHGAARPATPGKSAGRRMKAKREIACEFKVARVVHGKLKMVPVKPKLRLPPEIVPGTPEAQEWGLVACKRAQQNQNLQRGK